MTQEKAKKIHLIYGCIAAVLIVALGIAMAVSCWGIYQSGPRPYTRASIGEKLQDMSVLLYLNLVAILGGIALNIFLPIQRTKPKAIRDELVTMKKLAAKAGSPSELEKNAIDREHRNRWIYRVVTAGVIGGLLPIPVLYLFDPSHFPGGDPTAEIIAAVLTVLPAAIIGLLTYFVCSVLTTKSILRETDIYKQIIASGNKATAAPEPDRSTPVLLKTVRWAIFVIALVFIVLGIFNGSATDVLTKAVKICTECIGLG